MVDDKINYLVNSNVIRYALIKKKTLQHKYLISNSEKKMCF